MSLRLEMLQVARLAPGVLGASAALVEGFIRGCQNPDGGFRGKSPDSDLYYTSFAVDALTALQVPVPEKSLLGYLDGFGSGEELDFVHLCCLSRLWSAVRTRRADPVILQRLFSAVESFRTPDGGYEAAPGAPHGSAYGSLLGYSAYADHSRMPPRVDALGHCLDGLSVGDGSWSNDPRVKAGAGPATAAAVSLCRNLRLPVPAETGAWLLGCFHPGGGFKAIPAAPIPDLLSTAVILHALDGLQIPLGGIKEACLDYVDSLWTNQGGFHGNWTDDDLDVEYTYYGLLALGHLAL